MLPNSWIAEIFKRMGLHYGSRLDTMWAGQDPQELHAFWARELANLAAAPEVIAHALDHLPEDKPPTLGEFKRLCASAPRPPHKLIPPPTANPEFVAKVLADLKKFAAGGNSGREWAYRLQLREMNGEKLTKAQRDMWRAAINSSPENNTKGGNDEL